MLYFNTSGPTFSVVRRFEEKTPAEGVERGQDAWTALREKVDDCSSEALQAVNLETETVKMLSDEDPDDFLYKQGDRCRDRLNSAISKEDSFDRYLFLQGHHPAVLSTRLCCNSPDLL